MSLITIKSLSKHYASEADCVKALDQVDLRVEEGTFLGVLGPSGSGKSTFLTILGGLTHPSAGSITIDGIDLYRLPGERLADFRREYLGFVFQSFNLVPYLTALENVMLPMAVMALSRRQKLAMAEKALKQVGLGHRQLHLPSQLSGGEQERVAIARALVNEPSILLADEPTGNLDSRTSEEIMGIFDQLSRAGTTVILVTHENDIAQHARRAVVLKDGRIVEDRRAG